MLISLFFSRQTATTATVSRRCWPVVAGRGAEKEGSLSPQRGETKIWTARAPEFTCWVAKPDWHNKDRKIHAASRPKEKIKDKLFNDFNGEIKSLGAWGGDFILASSNESETETYFKNKGFNFIVEFDKLILN